MREILPNFEDCVSPKP